jgi:hypothetical protein
MPGKAVTFTDGAQAVVGRVHPRHHGRAAHCSSPACTPACSAQAYPILTPAVARDETPLRRAFDQLERSMDQWYAEAKLAA